MRVEVRKPWWFDCLWNQAPLSVPQKSHTRARLNSSLECEAPRDANYGVSQGLACDSSVLFLIALSYGKLMPRPLSLCLESAQHVERYELIELSRVVVLDSRVLPKAASKWTWGARVRSLARMNRSKR